jgi:hypothetical protein
VPDAWVGQPLTFSFLVKVTGEGFVSPGIACRGGPVSTQSRIYAGGWNLASITFTPSSAGECQAQILTFGANGSTHVFLDEAKLGFGSWGLAGGGRYQQLELGGHSLLFGTTAPTTGTWKQGDIVFNSEATPGSALGWRVVRGGSPGTWEPMYVTTMAPGQAAHVP